MKAFPFTALVAQAALQRALLLAAIDPGIGGVLITGPRGTAKSTSARALAALLPEGRFVTLPLGAGVEQLIGTLDLAAVLSDGSVRFSPGLLAKAHLGVLYVDEINLLPDTLIDPLLDVASSGVNFVEREGVSHTHAARFVLIGTMNPEEGELRPQLSDRFGLAVALGNVNEPQVRQEIVKTRLAFDADADAFLARHAAAQAALAAGIVAARERVAGLAFNDVVHAHVSELCIEAGVDGVRADLVMLKAARALAALEGCDAITVDHVDAVASWVLLHRQAHRVDAVNTRPAPAADSSTRSTDAPSQPDRAERQAPQQAGPQEPRQDPRQDPRARERASHHPTSPENAGQDPNGARRDDGEWGYMAPAPTGTSNIKRLRPLPPKKA